MKKKERISVSKAYLRRLPDSSERLCLECGKPLPPRMRIYCSVECRKAGTSRRRAAERRIHAPVKDFRMSDPWAEGHLGEEVTRGALLDDWAGRSSPLA